jgi:hypothetical protein
MAAPAADNRMVAMSKLLWETGIGQRFFAAKGPKAQIQRPNGPNKHE